MFIFRQDLAALNLGSKRLRWFSRRQLKKNWPEYVAERKRMLALMMRERARGDTLARLEPGYGFMRGIRLGDGGLLCCFRESGSLKRAANKSHKPRKLERPSLPRLHLFEEGHERAGQLILLQARGRTRRIRRPL